MGPDKKIIRLVFLHFENSKQITHTHCVLYFKDESRIKIMQKVETTKKIGVCFFFYFTCKAQHAMLLPTAFAQSLVELFCAFYYLYVL